MDTGKQLSDTGHLRRLNTPYPNSEGKQDVQVDASTLPGAASQPFEYEPPPLGPNDPEICADHCGICHSDLSMLHDEWGMTTYPFVPGHEVAGPLSAMDAKVPRIVLEVRAEQKALGSRQKVKIERHSTVRHRCIQPPSPQSHLHEIF